MSFKIVGQDEHDMLGDEAEALLKFLKERNLTADTAMQAVSYAIVLMVMNLGRSVGSVSMQEKLDAFDGYAGAMRASLDMNMRIVAGLEQPPVHNLKN